MKCKKCCFWSQVMAKAIDGIVFALCENKNSERYMEYTGEYSSGCYEGEEK